MISLKSRGHGDRALDFFIHANLIFLALLCLYPLYHVLIISLSDPTIVMKKNAVMAYPQGIHFDAYRIVFANRNIATGFKNSIYYISIGTVFVLSTSIMTAYVLAKKNVKLKRVIMLYFTITMYFGGGLIPFFLLINRLQLMNTSWAILLPGAFSVWNIIIMRTHFANLPPALTEVAMMDGANDVTILFRILVPLSGSVIAVLALFSIVGFWNMWYEPMIFLTERAKYPIQSVLREILIDSNPQMMAGGGNVALRLSSRHKSAAQILIKYANIIVCTVPILAIYPFLQKYFVKGVMVGSLKG